MENGRAGEHTGHFSGSVEQQVPENPAEGGEGVAEGLGEGEEGDASPYAPSLATPPAAANRKRVEFFRVAVVADTYGTDEYGREAEEERELSKRELSRIYRELDHFKLLEMEIHPDSIQNTLLHKRY